MDHSTTQSRIPSKLTANRPCRQCSHSRVSIGSSYCCKMCLFAHSWVRKGQSFKILHFLLSDTWVSRHAGRIYKRTTEWMDGYVFPVTALDWVVFEAAVSMITNSWSRCRMAMITTANRIAETMRAYVAAVHQSQHGLVRRPVCHILKWTDYVVCTSDNCKLCINVFNMFF